MADIIETQVPVEQTSVENIPAGVPPEVHQQMQFALTGKLPEENVQQEANATANAPIENTNTEPAPFSFDIFKNEFQYEKPEQVVEDLRNYRTLKENPAPPPVAEIKWEGENVEDSKKIFDALRAGKVDEVYSFLHEQQKIGALTTQDVTEANAPEIIKLGMALKYKELTSAEIDYKFNQLYRLPKEPKMLDTEYESEFEARHNEWKERVEDIKTSLVIDAKLAKPDLLSAKKNLVLPTIEQPQTQSNPNYDNFQKEWELLDKEFEATSTAVKTFTPNQFELKQPFSDKDNGINFEFQFVPDQESFTKTAQSVLEDPLRSTAYRNQDGTIDSKASFKDQYILQNFEKIILAAMNQAKNATIKAMLPDNSQPSGMNRMPIDPIGEKSDLQKQMDIALGQYMTKGRQNQLTN